MADGQKVANAIALLSKEHKLITDYMAKFEKNKKDKNAHFFSELSSFMSFLEKDMRHHFEIEEKAFFPAAVNGAPAYDTSMVVLSLQKDHGKLETLLSDLLKKKDRISSARIDDALINELTEFLNTLKIHAKRELIELFPLMNESIKCRTLLIQYLNDMEHVI